MAKRALPASLRRELRQAQDKLRAIRPIWHALGWSTPRYLVAPLVSEVVGLLTHRQHGSLFALTSPEADHPLTMRRGSSDALVFRQIFVEGEYHPFHEIRDCHTIVDCGGNIGCSSAWFLSQAPAARIVVIEPDGRNVEILRRNLAPYGNRAIVVAGAVWSRAAPLTVVRGVFGDGREWATMVRESTADETPDLVGMDVPSLYAMTESDTIDLLKVDIEGAERDLFADPSAPWLRIARCTVIEIHGATEDAIVRAALPATANAIATSGELTWFRRR